MSVKNAFSGATVPIAAALVIAIAAAIGVGIWVTAPDKDASNGAAQPLVSETGTAIPTVSPAAQPEVAQDVAQEDSTAQPVQPTTQTYASDPVQDPAQDPEPAQNTAQTSVPEHLDEPATEPMTAAVAETEAETERPEVTDTATADTVQKDVAQNDVATTAQPAQVAPSGVALDGAPVTLDIVRIPPDGITTVAGHAPANTDVVIYVDGAEVSRATTNAGGEFVALFDLMASDAVREMTVGVVENGKTTFAAASIVVAPATKPIVTAAAETIPDAATDEDTAETSAQKSESATAAPDGQLEASSALTVETPVASVPSVSETATQDATPETTKVDTQTAPVNQTPTVLKADDEGVKVIQQAGTNADSVRIDALTYDPDGRVFASGRAPSGSAIRLYLDTVLAAQTQTGADGQWRVELKDVAAGVYTLRADQIGPDGKVVTRAETPFKREDIAVLAQIAGQAEQEGAAIAAKADVPANNDANNSAPSAESRAQASDTADTAQETTPKPPSRIASVTVQPGNTLWGIATDRYGDGFLFSRVFNANKTQIRDPDLIYPGQVFVLPK